ncbi:MAG TPA: prolipoprotein diacylglyceryl transferase [Candidatus Moranbacteria bacterium]|nr:prolipoprotein diacylglyceryl transferase [Candidatus Moranbacteria bacterium]
MISWYQNFPLSMDPIAFTVGSFSVRWYALSYITAFLVIYLVLMWRVKKEETKNITKISNDKFQNRKEIQNTILDFLLVAFFAALIGGRIGYILFYNFSYFLSHPLSIIWPFENGSFVGFYGMSYHGGLIGILIGSWLFLRWKKINFRAWADFVIPAVPLGYFFGRVGNFLNGELYGRITNSPWGMYFTGDQTSLRWPSQLIEAFLEGIALFAFLWLMRKKETMKGKMLGVYFIGYGSLRIFGEFFREPDPQIGLIFNFCTLGQILSLIMVLAGFLILLSKKPKK